MTKKSLMVLGALLAVLALATTANASTCEGLACPSVSAGVVPDSTFLPILPDGVRDLTTLKVSGFYAFNTPGLVSERGVAYVVTPGTWDSAPTGIRSLPLANDLQPAERTSKWLVIYGPGVMESGPWLPRSATATASKAKRRSGVNAIAAALTDCGSPWFCVWTGTNGSGTKCQWQSVGVWQSMSGTSCYLNGESMANTRSAWSLIKRNDGRNYCAQPISSDSTLANNGFSNVTTDTYNSTATTKQSGWNCAN